MVSYCIGKSRVRFELNGFIVTRWMFTYRDAEGFEWVETLTKRERMADES